MNKHVKPSTLAAAQKHGIAVAVEWITPAIAAAYMATMAANRKIRPGKVAQLVRDMLAGHFYLNGESVIFDALGALRDGQHRLQAIIDSGVSAFVVVVRGISEEAAATLDRGAVRTVADVIDIRGGVNCRVLAASIKKLYNYKIGNGTDRTMSETLEFLAKHPRIAESVQATAGSRHVQPSILAAVHYMGSVIASKPQETEEFSEIVMNGKLPGSGGTKFGDFDPAFMWREHVIEKKRTRGAEVTPVYVIRGTIQAWNWFIAGKTRKVIRVPDETVNMAGVDRQKL